MSSKRSRVHPPYKTKYRVTNWASYNKALVNRGNLRLWISPDAIANWNAKPNERRRGGQPKYSDLAIETALTLGLAYHLPQRQTEGFVTSIFELMSLHLDISDHTTLCEDSSRRCCLRFQRYLQGCRRPPGTCSRAASQERAGQHSCATGEESVSQAHRKGRSTTLENGDRISQAGQGREHVLQIQINDRRQASISGPGHPENRSDPRLQHPQSDVRTRSPEVCCDQRLKRASDPTVDLKLIRATTP